MFFLFLFTGRSSAKPLRYNLFVGAAFIAFRRLRKIRLNPTVCLLSLTS